MSNSPTQAPTYLEETNPPTYRPTPLEETNYPTAKPTFKPTLSPSVEETVIPTENITNSTYNLSSIPTSFPSISPTGYPTIDTNITTNSGGSDNNNDTAIIIGISVAAGVIIFGFITCILYSYKPFGICTPDDMHGVTNIDTATPSPIDQSLQDGLQLNNIRTSFNSDCSEAYSTPNQGDMAGQSSPVDSNI